MPEQRFLRKKGTDRFYVFTEEQAKKDSMVEVSPQFVKETLERKKKLLEQAKVELETGGDTDSLKSDLKELHEVEAEYADIQAKIQAKKDGQPEESEEENATSTEDPAITEINAMDNAKDLVSYITGEFGEVLDARKFKGEKGVQELKDIAVAKLKEKRGI